MTGAVHVVSSVGNRSRLRGRFPKNPVDQAHQPALFKETEKTIRRRLRHRLPDINYIRESRLTLTCKR